MHCLVRIYQRKRHNEKGTIVMKTTPCQGCTDRELGCHAKCAGYKHWKLEIRAEREALDKQNKEINAIESGHYRRSHTDLKKTGIGTTQRKTRHRGL